MKDKTSTAGKILEMAGGLALFVAAGYFTLKDIERLVNGAPLWGVYSPGFPKPRIEDMGIAFTLILGLLAVIGLAAFVVNLVDLIREARHRKANNGTHC